MLYWFGGEDAAAPTPYALQFDDGDGTNGNAVVAADTGLPTGGSARTIAFWLKFPTGSSTDFGSGMAFRYGNTNPLDIDVGQGAGCFMRVSGGGSYDFLFGSTAIPADSTWHWIVAICDGSDGWSLYVDNVLDTSGTIATDTDTGGYCSVGANASLYMGSLVGGDFVNGVIDDVRVYGSALDSTQRATLYNSGSGVTNDPIGGILRWYKFNEGTGTTAADSGSNGEDGTLYGSPGGAGVPSWVTGKV